MQKGLIIKTAYRYEFKMAWFGNTLPIESDFIIQKNKINNTR